MAKRLLRTTREPFRAVYKSLSPDQRRTLEPRPPPGTADEVAWDGAGARSGAV